MKQNFIQRMWTTLVRKWRVRQYVQEVKQMPEHRIPTGTVCPRCGGMLKETGVFTATCKVCKIVYEARLYDRMIFGFYEPYPDKTNLDNFSGSYVGLSVSGQFVIRKWNRDSSILKW